MQHHYYATAADFAELYGSTEPNGNPNGAKRLGAFVVGSFTPLSGAAFGPGRNNVALSGNNRVTNADPTTGVVFWPASGHRTLDHGAVYGIGSQGQSFSSTASTSANGFHFSFTSTTIYPQNNVSRSYALPVRCIRD